MKDDLFFLILHSHGVLIQHTILKQQRCFGPHYNASGAHMHWNVELITNIDKAHPGN